MPVFATTSQLQAAQNKFDNWVNGSEAKGHITDSNAQHLKKAFKNALTNHATPQVSLDEFSKKIKGMKKHFKTPQTTTSLVKKTAEKILLKAQATNTPKIKKADTGPKTALFTAKITTPKARAQVKKILTAWKSIATKRKELAKKSKISAHQQELAEDSFSAITNLKKNMPNKPLYIAYDVNNKVQAIALAIVSKKKDTEIDFIATHPDNVVIFGDENPVRGAGTALMRHIAQNTVKKNKKGGVHLYSYKTAIPFYKKIGFTGFTTGVQSNVYEANLTKKKMTSFLKSHKHVGTIKSSEPAKFI